MILKLLFVVFKPCEHCKLASNTAPYPVFKNYVPWPKKLIVGYLFPLYSLERKAKVKGKAIPLQSWTGPESYSRLRLPDFKKIGT